MPSALVFLTEELPAHPRELGPLLAPVLGMVAYDVIAALKRSPVLPFEELDDETAAAVLKKLDDRQIAAAIVPSDRLPPDPQVFKVHNADVEGEGLNVQVDVVGKMRMIPWDGIELVSAATIKTEKSLTRTHRPTGLAEPAMNSPHMGLHFRRIHMPRKHKRVESAEVVAIWPRGMAGEIQFHSNAFNFDYLNERVSTSARENMRHFAADLSERIEGSVVGPGFDALVAKDQSPPEMGLKAFTRHNRWLMLREQESI